MDFKRQALKKFFGYNNFKNEQEKIIDYILSGRDTLAIMPTGAGKSICYQIPALLSDGITLVVSPLISLMKDQVSNLLENGIRAAYINSSLTQAQCKKAFENAINGLYKIIYIAPERLNTYDVKQLASRQRISIIAIDEAHCVSQWGHDFRPQYSQIKTFINSLSYRPTVCAFTATATSNVKTDIITLLDLTDPYVAITGFDRQNLFFEVRQPENKFEELLKLLVSFEGKSGIIYCSTRKTTDKLWNKLGEKGYLVSKYHAGLTDEERKLSQDDFLYGRTDIMIATNAFGMGIDKSDVNFIIHYNMPSNMEAYYQEAGRAGRDGTSSKCVLLFSPADIITNKFLIENNTYDNVDELTTQRLKKRAYERLNYMSGYSTTTGCLRKYILNYFDEDLKDDCGNCFNCIGEFEKEDVTDIGIEVIFCVQNLGQTYGKNMIIKILKGVIDDRTQKKFILESASFGRLTNIDSNLISRTIDELLIRGYLSQTGDKYPVLTISDKIENIIKHNERIFVRKLLSTKKSKNDSRTMAIDTKLYNALVKERKRLAIARGVPAFMIFSNATLEDMCIKKPTSRQDMLEVSGIGHTKLTAYGQYFIKVINDYLR